MNDSELDEKSQSWTNSKQNQTDAQMLWFNSIENDLKVKILKHSKSF